MSVKLPITNKYGFYEIRLESIGGLGANISGKILGELGVLKLGLNASNFASYGSEKRGTPVKSFVRYCAADQEIKISSPVEQPHILGLFHNRLAGKIPVMAGINENSIVIVNTSEDPDTVRDQLKMHAGRLVCVDALQISIEEKTRINMVMLGAIAKVSGFISLEAMEEVVKDTIGKKYPAALPGNLAGVRRGYEEINEKFYEADGKYDYQEYAEVKRDWGWDNMPIGGLNYLHGSTVDNDLTASREGFVPIFHKDKCINCGLCDSTCPDMVYQFAEGEFRGKPAMVNLGPDYHHCKGCLRCVEVCPTAALTEGREREVDIWKDHIRNQDLIVDKMEFEDSGAYSMQTTESEESLDI
ncbi:pyruvate ferredoxin oxidoreductase gamma subunit [Natranaerovirga pectinivora]|uniref:Pyruvate ferredoxin oxidoreductase gamma subunit n=1 Tax=Natranaerovirga pectinivora TaxID=682400 RepID=A0A4R3MEQ4_9FIRM|nr:2-oxoacid:acceptor oxidoreductase family protein [Natranaerovirga pectinivora]TCT12281.1 pyruvate ferredoxin oxidoreductase gamma subunit [Natranaerovirga pectinivora]